MKLDVSAEGVRSRLCRMAELSDLRTERRLAVKIDMSWPAVERRLRVQSMLRDSCLRFAQVARATGGKA